MSPNAFKLKQTVSALLKWFSVDARDLPWRRTHDPYAVWISEIMLQQTQVKTVIPYFERWMRELPTVETFAKARQQKILKLWEGLGYYTRVRNAQAAARIVVKKFGGKFPSQFEEILDLPGIGRYTAGAISSIAFNQPSPILDGNVIRILCRIFGIDGDPREKATNARLWELAQELVLVDQQHCSEFNQSMMELGALICTPRQPQCEKCPVKKMCVAFRESRINELPAIAKRAAATERRFHAFVTRKDNKFLVRQRPEGVVNAHLWEFPNEEILGKGKPRSDAPFCTVRHSITRYRILLEAFHVEDAADPLGIWKTLPQLHKLPFTSAHKKILAALGGK